MKFFPVICFSTKSLALQNCVMCLHCSPLKMSLIQASSVQGIAGESTGVSCYRELLQGRCGSRSPPPLPSGRSRRPCALPEEQTLSPPPAGEAPRRACACVQVCACIFMAPPLLPHCSPVHPRGGRGAQVEEEQRTAHHRAKVRKHRHTGNARPGSRSRHQQVLGQRLQGWARHNQLLKTREREAVSKAVRENRRVTPRGTTTRATRSGCRGDISRTAAPAAAPRLGPGWGGTAAGEKAACC